MVWVKNKQIAYIETIIKYQPIKANDTHSDNTKNDLIMFISFFVKLIELVTLIFITSYFFLILWVLLCEAIEDFIYNETVISDCDHMDQFFPHYGLKEDTLGEVMLKIFYFAFTSLTTVGFGDFLPISQWE